MLTRAPGTPTDKPIALLLKLSRTPGMSFIERRNLSDTSSLYFQCH